MKLSTRELTENVRTNGLVSKTATLDATLSRYSARCYKALVPEESTRVEMTSIDTLVLLRGVRGKIQIVREYLNASIAATTATTVTDTNVVASAAASGSTGTGVPYSYCIASARCVVLLCDADYFMRVMELLLCSEWGITDAQFVMASKRALPVQKQMHQVLNVLLASLRREGSIEIESLTLLESTVSSMAMTTDRVLHSSIDGSGSVQPQTRSTGSGVGSGYDNKEDTEEASAIAAEGVEHLRRALAAEDVGHGIVRLLSLSTLMQTVLEQHRHALSSTEENKEEDSPRSTQSTVVAGLHSLIGSHCSMHDDVVRTLDRLLVHTNDNSGSSGGGGSSRNSFSRSNHRNGSMKPTELSEVSEQIGTCRTRLASVISSMDEVTPGAMEELQRAMYEVGSSSSNNSSSNGEDSLPPCVDLHKSIRERFAMILTHACVKELSQPPSSTPSTTSTTGAAGSAQQQNNNDMCPAFERQARLLREKISTATQLENDQKTLKKTLAKRIQEVYMKQRELDTVGVRCDKLKHKVADAQQHIDAAKTEAGQCKQDAARESKHFEEAMDELNHDVDRLENENRRMRKQLENGGGGGGGGGGSSSPHKREDSTRRRRRGSDMKRTTDQIKREWRTDGKGSDGSSSGSSRAESGGVKTKVSSDNNTTTNTNNQSSSSDRVLALRRALDYVVAENLRLKAMVVQRRMQRMAKLPTVVHYKAVVTATEEKISEFKGLHESNEFKGSEEQLSNTPTTPEAMADVTDVTNVTDVTDVTDVSSVGSVGSVGIAHQHARMVRACNVEAVRLTNRVRMTRATRTVVNLTLHTQEQDGATPTKTNSLDGWSVLSQRNLENAQARKAYCDLTEKVQDLAKAHSVELGLCASQDFGLQNYSLIPIKEGGAPQRMQRMQRMGVLKTVGGSGAGGRVVRVPMSCSKLVQLHKKLLQV